MDRKSLPVSSQMRRISDYTFTSIACDSASKRRTSNEISPTGKKSKNLTLPENNAQTSKRINFPPGSPLNTPARRAAPRLLDVYGMMPVTNSVVKKRTRRNSLSKERIKVCVRKRPLSSSEVNTGTKDIALVDKEEQSLSIECSKMGLDGLSRSNGYMKFFYDYVFDENQSNTQVFNNLIHRFII
jgi:kinesin family member 2/24